RTALHSYALQGTAPGRVLELVDRFVRATGEEAMATAAYGVFDAETGVLTFATAAHVPPILISGGEAQSIEITPAAPLGAFPYGSYVERELRLAEGDVLLLYTDGLVERRGAGLGPGTDLLQRVGSQAGSA